MTNEGIETLTSTRIEHDASHGDGHSSLVHLSVIRH